MNLLMNLIIVLLMIEIKVREGEDFEQAYRRFKAIMGKENIWADVKKKEFYTKPSKVRRSGRQQHKK